MASEVGGSDAVTRGDVGNSGQVGNWGERRRYRGKVLVTVL